MLVMIRLSGKQHIYDFSHDSGALQNMQRIYNWFAVKARNKQNKIIARWVVMVNGQCSLSIYVSSHTAKQELYFIDHRAPQRPGKSADMSSIPNHRE